MQQRKIVVPGEVVASGYNILPGDGTRRVGKDIVALKHGLLNIENNTAKIIPLAGAYIPRVGNTVIGQVVDITFNGWLIDVLAPHLGFLPITECGRFVNKDDLAEYLNVHDIIVAKVNSVKLRSIELSMKGKGMQKLTTGLIIRVSPVRVARIIGRGGSMVNAIKQATNTKIIVGQNGLIWISGKTADDEIVAKEAIELVAAKPLLDGLTEKVKEFIEQRKKEIEKSKQKTKK